MTNEDGNKVDNTKENMTDGAKKFGEKTGEVIGDIAKGAKKASEKAEVAIDSLKEGTKKASEKASDVFDNILTGMKKAGDKASDTVKILEIKHEISQLESANKKIVPQIGDAVLVLYTEKKIKDATLTAFCEEIEKNDGLIEEKKAQIEAIKERETE